MVVCLDTDFLIDYLADRPEAAALAAVLRGPVLVSSLSVYELLSQASGRRTAQVEALARDYAIVPVGYAVSSMAAEIQRELGATGELIPHFDSLIAATAILADAPLVTSDPHYDRVPPRFELVVQHYRRA